MVQKDLKSNQPRVLIVENDDRWRVVHKKNLIDWGCQAVIAQGEGQSLLDDAIDKVEIYRCHLAIVDMKLIDHDNRSDQSGLNLIPNLQPAQSIIVSGYADFIAARTALMEKGAKHFIGKEEGPELLRDVIQEVLETICAAIKKIEIEWPPGLSAEAIVSRLLPHARDSVPVDQVNDVFALLFPEAKHIRLQTLDGANHLSSSGPTLHSVVLKVYVDERVQPEIVKIATPEDIEKQEEGYKKYIDGHLTGTFYTNLKDQACLWDIGAARYDFLGAPNQSMITWAKLYQSSESVEEIMKPLNFFFDQLWHHYYNRADRKCCCSLLEAYCDVWGVNWRKRLQTYSKDKYLKINVLKSVREILNPVKWLVEKIEAENQLDKRIPLTCLAITHGDFHGENLFVHEGRAWVIDFERTGFGPILQDFIEIESNILIQLANFKDIGEFYEFVTMLLKLTGRDDIKSTSPLNDGEAKKVFAVLEELHKLAQKTTDSFNITEHLSALLLNCLFLISLPRLDDQQRKKAQVLGGLICEKLEEQWGVAGRM